MMKMFAFILELLSIIIWTVCAVLNFTVALFNPLYWFMFSGDVLLVLISCIIACLFYYDKCKQAKATDNMK